MKSGEIWYYDLEDLWHAYNTEGQLLKLKKNFYFLILKENGLTYNILFNNKVYNIAISDYNIKRKDFKRLL